MAFVQQVNFAGGHIFPFSARPGTPAATYDQQIPKAIRKRRSTAMRALFAEMTHQYQSTYLGKTVEVLWESGEQMPDGRWLVKGLTGNYLRIATKATRDLANQITQTKIIAFSEHGLNGEITN